MTIFQLLVYSCVTANGLDGELLAKTCRWQVGSLYVAAAKCEEAGAARFMERMFSDIYEDLRVEKHKCVKVWVNE